VSIRSSSCLISLYACLLSSSLSVPLIIMFFRYSGFRFLQCNVDKASFPCLRAYFHLTRRLKAYILNTYVPSFLVVLLSWLSFWIDPESAPARTSLSILTILTITTQSSGLMRSLPSGSITKAIDVWMATCLVFVFGAFIEYSAVNTLARRRKEKVDEIFYNSTKAKQRPLETNDTVLTLCITEPKCIIY